MQGATLKISVHAAFTSIDIPSSLSYFSTCQFEEPTRFGGGGNRVPIGQLMQELVPCNSPAFAAIVARSRCFNFAERETPLPVGDRRGFVTIYENGRIVWQGTEGDEPAKYRQAELDI